MPSEFESDASDDELQFANVEPETTAPAAAPVISCVLCKRPIVSEYFAIRDKTLCPECIAKVTGPPAGSAAGRFFKSLGIGLGAGLLGALIWYAIRVATGYEIGLVAVAVGFMVGKSVRKGSGNRGGPGYQAMAVLITYLCIAATYLPEIVRGLIEESAGHAISALEMVFAFGVFLASPIITFKQNPIGFLLIGFALYEAWRFTRKAVLPITGPYQVGTRGTAAGGYVTAPMVRA